MKALDNRFYVKFMQLEIGLLALGGTRVINRPISSCIKLT